MGGEVWALEIPVILVECYIRKCSFDVNAANCKHKLV